MHRSLMPAALAAAAALLCGCAQRLEQPVEGYTCCNLVSLEGNWVSSNNVLGGPRLPAGSKAHFDSIKRTYYAYGQIGGRDYGVRNDAGKDEASTIAFLHRIVVKEDPAIALASWPPEVQVAVRDSHLRLGMTRAQVLMAIGYPPADETPKIEADVWRYWLWEDDQHIDLHFDADGKLAHVAGEPKAVRTILVPSAS